MRLEQEAEKFLKEKYNMSDFNSYQRSASKTAIYPDEHRILYPALGLAGEAGEVVEVVEAGEVEARLPRWVSWARWR